MNTISSWSCAMFWKIQHLSSYPWKHPDSAGGSSYHCSERCLRENVCWIETDSAFSTHLTRVKRISSIRCARSVERCTNGGIMIYMRHCKAVLLLLSDCLASNYRRYFDHISKDLRWDPCNGRVQACKNLHADIRERFLSAILFRHISRTLPANEVFEMKPVHCLSPVSSWSLKKCIIVILRVWCRKSEAVVYKTKKPIFQGHKKASSTETKQYYS